MAEPVRFQHFEVPLRGDGSLFELGRGAMGITYKAFDTNLRCFVALKVINATFLGSEVARERFLREARAAAALRHPNVATVFHLGEEGGDWFYAMEFVDGETVEAMMKREGAIPTATALGIVIQVARAFGAAQKQGLVHRDIKPSNLMLVREDDGEFTVKVIDFGLAKNTAGGGDDTATLTMGGFLGTPHFASPEQLEERELDVRSDIYSLGVTLYYMLAGRAPFSGSLAQVMSQHLHREPPLETLSGQPPQVVELLRHMLAKNPGGRPQTPSDLRREAEACLAAVSGSPDATPPAPATDPENFETQLLEAAPATGAVPAGHDRIGRESKPAHSGGLFQADLVETTEPVREAASPLPPPEKSGFSLPLVIGAGLAIAGGGAFLLLPKSSAPPPAPVAAATPVASPSPTPAATPSPTATPDPVAEGLSKARKIASDDPAAALGSLVALARAHTDRAEAREAVVEFLTALHSRRDGLSRNQRDSLREPLEAAAALDVVEAQLILGGELLESDPEGSLPWLLAAAKNGNADAMVLVGLALAKGVGSGSPDLPAAFDWFQRAADRGDARAMFALGECYYYSKGVARDPRLALEWLYKAAGQDNAHALDMLGTLSSKGIPGVLPRDLSKAFWYFTAAKDLGFAPAYGNLGVLFMTAPPEQADKKLAVELFKQGTEKGDPRCMYFYAGCLRDGLGEVTKDKAAAQEWYVKAAELGVQEARDWCRANNVNVPAKSPR